MIKNKQSKKETSTDKQKETINPNGYKLFSQLSQEELDTILLYEEKVAKMSEKYITEFDSKKIKQKYGDCIFPPFVLDMMKKVVKFS